MKPAKKDPNIEKHLDNLNFLMFGRKRTESIINNICVSCGANVTEDSFSNEIEKAEYPISGLCSSCQKKQFIGENK